MKALRFLITLFLLISTFGGLALTASEYVDCKDLYPDEFLDLAAESPHPILPVFASSLNTHPYLLCCLKIFHFQKIGPLSSILRC
jgi:hypothetical protein